jgi:hypothetical protein
VNLLEAIGPNGEYEVRLPSDGDYCVRINQHGILVWKHNESHVTFTLSRLKRTDWQRVPKQPEVPEGYRLMTAEDKVIPRGRKYWSDFSNQWEHGTAKVGAEYVNNCISICPIEGSWNWAQVAMDAGLKVENDRWRGYPKYWYKENKTYKCVRSNGEIKNILIDYKVIPDGWQLYTEPKPTQEEVDRAKDTVIELLIREYLVNNPNPAIKHGVNHYIELKSKLEEK